MKKNEFSISISVDGPVCIAEISGNIGHGFEDRFMPLITGKLDEDFRNFVFDLQKVEVIESPAVACLLSSSEKIVDDYQGHLVFTGLSTMHAKILEMVGVFLYANACESKVQAISECKA